MVIAARRLWPVETALGERGPKCEHAGLQRFAPRDAGEERHLKHDCAGAIRMDGFRVRARRSGRVLKLAIMTGPAAAAPSRMASVAERKSLHGQPRCKGGAHGPISGAAPSRAP